VIDGPNICKNHLLGENGCEFSKKGRRCFYSHDLSKAGLPLYDKDMLKGYLVQLEAQMWKMCNFETFASLQENAELVEEGKLTEEEFETRCANKEDVDDREISDFLSRSQERAEKVIAQAKKGEQITDINEGKILELDPRGLSGAEILKQCGVEKPFAAQKERKEFGQIGQEILGEILGDMTMPGDFNDGWEIVDESIDSGNGQSGKNKKGQSKSKAGKKKGRGGGGFGFGSGSGMFGFSDDDVMELACQGVKPWDDDAGDVLAALSYF